MLPTKIPKRTKLYYFLSTLMGILLFCWYTSNRTVYFKSGIAERITAACIYPFLVISNHVSETVHTIIDKKKSYAALVAKNNELQRTNEALQATLIMLGSSMHASKEADEILTFKKRYNLSNAVLAKVLTRTISSQEHSMIINRGIRDGVKKDMAALYKLQIVGKVIEVYDFYSKIQLITDSQAKVAGHTNTTGAGGIVTGCNDPHTLTFNYVSYINPVQEEDLVFSSGQGMIFPEGFCLGKIAKLVTQDKALYHEIEITPLVAITELSYCLLTDQSKIEFF